MFSEFSDTEGSCITLCVPFDSRSIISNFKELYYNNIFSFSLIIAIELSSKATVLACDGSSIGLQDPYDECSEYCFQP